MKKLTQNNPFTVSHSEYGKAATQEDNERAQTLSFWGMSACDSHAPH